LDDEVPVGSGAGTVAYLALPTSGTNGCSGSADKLLYNTATNAFSCGADAGAGGGMTSWTLAGDSGPAQTITDGNTASIVGDATGIDTATADATDTVTISFDPAEAEAGLEAVLDLADLQGAVTDAQVPNNITVDLATTATTANAGDSATAFFTTGTIEAARLPDLSGTYEPAGVSVADVTDLDNDAATLSLPASVTISAFGATLVDDADAATARTTLDVDQAGTDNSTDVTLAGQDFLSLTGQQITANAINPDNLASTDFGDFTCNGTNCALDSYTGTLSFATTGNLLGAVNVSSKTAATYTVGTDAATESYGTLFVNGDNDAIDFTLPSAVAGMSACFVQAQGVSGAITVQPATGDYLVVDGVQQANPATDYTSTGDGADKLCIVAIDATNWIVTSETGTWAE
jgi:hypothetical protein